MAVNNDDKNFHVTSYNQSGGITAGSVNFGPKARSMDSRQGGQIQQHIPASAKVRVVSTLGDGEAFGFANQILVWLKANGYVSAEGVDQAVYSQPVMGQQINKKGDGSFEIIVGMRQ